MSPLAETTAVAAAAGGWGATGKGLWLTAGGMATNLLATAVGADTFLDVAKQAGVMAAFVGLLMYYVSLQHHSQLKQYQTSHREQLRLQRRQTRQLLAVIRKQERCIVEVTETIKELKRGMPCAAVGHFGHQPATPPQMYQDEG